MATKLKNLKIRKVDFVDEGANPDAHIKMIKRKDEEEAAAEDISKKEPNNILKKLFGFIGKAAGIEQDEIDTAMDQIQKGESMSFQEKIHEVDNRKIADEMWDICFALQSSFISILNDEELDHRDSAAAMQESLEEFHAMVQESIPKWSNGKEASFIKKNEVAEENLEIMKAAAQRLGESIKKASKDIEINKKPKEKESCKNKNLKGDNKKMEIDKSKLTDAERAFLESIEKRYGTEDRTGAANEESATIAPAGQTMPLSSAEPTVTKSVTSSVSEAVSVTPADEADSIYKGLHPAVRAELESLKKFREEAEDRELAGIAKKYAIIGKKEEELVPLFKSLKAAGGTAYNDMIALLDQAVTTVEKSGAFSEIGKSGHDFSTAGVAEAKIEGIAKSYMEKDSSLTYTAAVAKAWEDNPELMNEYEEEAGF